MPDMSDDRIERIVSRYPPAAEITPGEFEAYVADVIEAVGTEFESFHVKRHVLIEAPDGDYDFDAVATFEVGGMAFTILIEAKRHANPIKRELVQALHAKQLSLGAHKSILVAAGRFQSGAIRYAFSHGIALATLSEGRLAYETHSAGPTPTLDKKTADDLGFESFAAMASVHNDNGTIRGFRLSPQYVDSLVEWMRE